MKLLWVVSLLPVNKEEILLAAGLLPVQVLQQLPVVNHWFLPSSDLFHSIGGFASCIIQKLRALELLHHLLKCELQCNFHNSWPINEERLWHQTWWHFKLFSLTIYMPFCGGLEGHVHMVANLSKTQISESSSHRILASDLVYLASVTHPSLHT